MRVIQESEFDVFTLFVHDQWDAGGLDEAALAEALTTYLRHRKTGDPRTELPDHQWEDDDYDFSYQWTVQEPSGLDRFVLVPFRERMYSVKQVRARFPRPVVKALDLLNRRKQVRLVYQNGWRLQ